MKNLVIVESPAKAKTIEKFLGPDFKVMSSHGHIRDLRKKDFSIDLENNYEPLYEVPADKKDLVKQLKDAAAKADTIWLASDEDREGEAIAWHLCMVLGLDPSTTRRIVFHEITEPAIRHAIENPRAIDINRVNAQQARRVLDRIVGFELSPVLWRKVMPALSAGRVQSVAVKLVCEREKEIRQFESESYMRVTGTFISSGATLKGELNKRPSDKRDAVKFLEDCNEASFRVKDVSVRPLHRSPAPPFSTSTLQQEAARKLGFSVDRTMRVAQKLYEAGSITYMRTDSLNLSAMALADIAKCIKADMGDRYLHTRKYHTKSRGAQEAHEAIRPTYIKNRTIDGTSDEKRLYELIWKRTIASQMSDAELEKTHVDIAVSNRPEIFECTGEVVKFDGFLKVYHSDDDRQEGILPSVEPGATLEMEQIVATQRFTLPPARYNEASLVKKLEELGIGRPSTYAPTISTIQGKDYVKKGENEGVLRSYDVVTLADGKITDTVETERFGSDKGRMVPTDIGMVVNDFLTEHFPDILDYGFTARVEEKFDNIAEGDLAWKSEINDFYNDFHPGIDRINALHLEHKVGERVLGTDPKSGKELSVKIGRYGPVAQLGTAGDDEKPLFASLMQGQSIETITFEQALKLFELPRMVGEYEGMPVVAATGRFGPYLKYGSMSVSLPKDESPLTVSLERSVELIRTKQEQKANSLIKEFPEEPSIQILNGRYGPYVAYKKEKGKKAVNYRIPKDKVPVDLTLEDVKAIIDAQDSAPARPRARKSAKK